LNSGRQKVKKFANKGDIRHFNLTQRVYTKLHWILVPW